MNVPASALYHVAPGYPGGAISLVVPGAWRPHVGDVSKSQLTSTILMGAGSTVLSLAVTAGAAAPFVAAIGGILELGGAVARMFSGCGATCTQATQYANQWGTMCQQIADKYWATPTPRPRSFQQATLKQLSDAIAWLNQACGNPALGPAGERCISERTVRGGTAPWCPSADHKGCDIYTTVVDPIANDPEVVSDSDWSALTGGTTQPISQAAASAPGSFDWTPILIGAALIAALVVIL